MSFIYSDCMFLIYVQLKEQAMQNHVGDHLWQRGTNYGAIGGPGGPAAAAVDGPGGPILGDQL